MHHAILVAGSGTGDRDPTISICRVAHRGAVRQTPLREASLGDMFARLFDAGDPALFDHVVDALIRAALDHCDGNQVQAARLLGISRNVLRSQLARMGLIPGRRRGPRAPSA